ncbi:IclR family transcriptional regulator [Microlunatus ginsengisoli]|uniref:IclR family transcriptional regulator n=1 Tax=Microlunatus ginsengisoli TaxID=363863 RepID=A0ABP6ZMN4_9ACTN
MGEVNRGPSVLTRAFAILDAFGTVSPELTHGAITQATGLAPATVHRLLAELVERDAVERIGRGRYRIGMHLWRLGSLAPAGRNLRDTALPYLQDLFEVTHEVVHLAVLDDDRVMYLEKLEARPGVSVVSGVGLRLPLHATGPGKVLLAHTPPDFAERILSGPLPRHASGTITDSRRLRATLAAIRQQGYAISRDEMTEGAASVAAPVRDSDQVVASISVVVPSKAGDLSPLIPPVRLAALGVTRELRRGRAR